MLEGYILPEPYFSVKLKSAVDRLIHCLKDASLPMLELQVIIFAIFLILIFERQYSPRALLQCQIEVGCR